MSHPIKRGSPPHVHRSPERSPPDHLAVATAAVPRRWPPAPPGGDIYANANLRESARTEMAVLLSRAHPSLNVPEIVVGYYAIVPIDPAPSPVFGLSGPPAMLYKAVSVARGTPTSLLRVIGPAPAPAAQIVRASEGWKRVRHPTILCLREVVTTRQFSAPATAPLPPANEVVFAHDFCARADTLYNVFLNAPTHDHRYHPLAETTLWAIATQLLSAVAVVHSNRLALRDSLTPLRVLVTGRNRVKVSCVGLSDALDPTGIDHIPTTSPARASTTNHDRMVTLQKADLAAVGHILATLALRVDNKVVRGGMLMCGEDVAVDAMRRVTPYSEDLTVLVMSLLNAVMPNSPVTTNQVLGMIGPRLALELGNVWTHSDSLESKLFVEFDSSRMFRLLVLLGFINERADAGVEPQWSETGDRYLLKLFRDYVFHRADENGNAELDPAHVVECLSRLDVGSPEQILLSSRDGASLLIPTYEEVRRCLMQAIDDLRRKRPVMHPR